MKKDHLDLIISRLLEVSGEKTVRRLSIWADRNENYFANCRNTGSIRLQTLMEICDEKGLDYDYIYSGVSSGQRIQKNENELLVNKAEYNKLKEELEHLRNERDKLKELNNRYLNIMDSLTVFKDHIIANTQHHPPATAQSQKGTKGHTSKLQQPKGKTVESRVPK